MNKIKRLALLQEFEQFLTSRFGGFEKEKVFNTFIDTKRRFRADYICFDSRIIIEINGGQFINGRHNRGGKGYENDLTKLNLAQMNGFKVYQFTYEMLERKEYESII